MSKPSIRPATKVTSAEVAQKAGVSQSAVSRVFTPGASASPKTVSKVRAAAAELGYRPNILARAMASGKSRIIGLVITYLENHFYPEVLEKLSLSLQNKGYHVLIFMVANREEDVEHVIDELLDFQVDGIIAASISMSSDLAQRCRYARVPIVFFNQTQDATGFPAVTSDNINGGKRVAEFLLAGGHKRIGYIAGWEGASTQSDREHGFLAGLHAAGRDVDIREVGDFNRDRAAEAARRMFDRPDRPDAVFVCNDHMAFAVIDVLRDELGLAVPMDVSVVGYDDVPTASYGGYKLTTVRQRACALVDEAVGILLEQIETPDAPKRGIAIDAPLVVRKSARIPKGWKA